jgi:hypothetical protein
MARRKLLNGEHRTRGEHQMKPRTDHPVQRSTRSARPTRDRSSRPERAVRSRHAHSEVKVAGRERQRELRAPSHGKTSSPVRSESRELTKPAGQVATGRWTDAAMLVFLVLSFANMVVFYWSLIGF